MASIENGIDPAEKFLENLDSIRKIAFGLACGKGFNQDYANDFFSYVVLKLIENDYRRIRLFRGESQMRTYLTTLLRRLLINYQEMEQGRWHTSASANKLGTLAEELEKLLYRDGFNLWQASQILKPHFGNRAEMNQLECIYIQLPKRQPKKRVSMDCLKNFPMKEKSDRVLDDSEWHRKGLIVGRVLQKAMTHLSIEEREILRLRFKKNLTIPEMSRQTGIKPRSLYFKIQKNLKKIRSVFAKENVTFIDALGIVQSNENCYHLENLI